MIIGPKQPFLRKIGHAKKIAVKEANCSALP